MDKLRKSTLFKVVIIIIFIVSLLASAISGIVSVSLYVEHALTKRGKEGLKYEIIESIAPEYNEWAREYYQRYINGENTYSDQVFFSEENMNYSFTAQVISESDVYPMLTNYETEDYQYKNSYFAEVNIDENYDYYEHKLSKKDIVNSGAYMMLSYNDVINLGLLDSNFTGLELWYESDSDEVILINANLVNTLREDFINKNGYDFFRNDDLEEYKEQIYYSDEDDSDVLVSIEETKESDSGEIKDDVTAAEFEDEDVTVAELDGYDATPAESDDVDAATVYDQEVHDYSDIYYDYEKLMYYGEGYEYIYHDYSDFYDADKQLDKIDKLEISNFNDSLFDSYNINILTDGTYYYVLQNVDTVKSYIDKLKNYNNVDYQFDYDMGYIDETDTVFIAAYVYKTVTVEIDWCIKSNLTAYDRFYNSLLLRYIDLLSSSVIPVFIISLIMLMLSGGFIIAVAGYKKNRDGVSLGIFDKIPYDVVWTAFGFIVFLALYWYDGNWVHYGSIESVILAAIIMSVVTFFTYIFYSTIVRLKCEGFAFLNKMVVFKLLRFIISLLKKLFIKLGSAVKYLWQHIHIYAKYVICIAAVALVELIVAMSENAPLTFGFIVIEKIIVSLILAYSLISIVKIKKYTKLLADSDISGELDTTHIYGAFKGYAEDLSNISDGIESAVNKQMKSEMMKTELITNVSHDIKTPLTSIINYVDLLEKEKIDNDKAKEYIEVLNRQSQRLKKLIIDLIDASKASTGNVEVNAERIDLDVILTQINGEYEEQFSAKSLKVKINNHVEDTHIMADGRHLYRVFDNIFVNIKKYAQDDTRVYINIDNDDSGDFLIVMIKNISAQELNISGEELMERFTRGDRSRNTEGSGLGLSIAKSLMELQGGNIRITVDGDLFKVELFIPRA
ncbi:MAG: GHKL domain-containing protein [Lachnospiraceae bacterium]|nr:GHKL domain-containing protein [Lachnospiraceae bacterium]